MGESHVLVVIEVVEAEDFLPLTVDVRDQLVDEVSPSEQAGNLASWQAGMGNVSGNV